MYKLGARRISVFGAPPIGCVPSQRTLGGGIVRECAENYNDAAKLFNSKLSDELDSLTLKLPNSKIVYTDIYTPLFDIIQHPLKYGTYLLYIFLLVILLCLHAYSHPSLS